MNWTELLRWEIETTYKTTEKLRDKVDQDSLQWKPATGNNWMTMGQLLRHISDACGAGCNAFLTGDWGLPEGKKFEDLTPEEMLPPAEKLSALASVEEARKLLPEDKSVARRAVNEAGEDDLANRRIRAPWAPNAPIELGRQMLQMVRHVDRHKSQLFYYLKLQGKLVNTGDLWGGP